MLATLERGDTVLVPNPSYPIHIYGAIIAGADIRSVRMTPGVDFFAEAGARHRRADPQAQDADPRLPLEPDRAVRRARVLRARDRDRAGEATRHLVVHDLAYADITFDGWKAPSIMQVPGAREVAVEFFTMSKSYNMAGWRIGFMVGNKDLVNALATHQELPRLRHLRPDPDRLDHRARGPAGMRRGDPPQTYQSRRDVMVKGPARDRAGWWENPKASMYVWARIPEALRRAWGRSSSRRSSSHDAKVAVSPGIGFGDYGDDHIRIALIENEHRLRQAVRGIRDMFRKDGLLKGAA